MPRRSPYTKVVKMNQIRAEHVSGMGDVVFKGFQCLDSECLEFITVKLRKNEGCIWKRKNRERRNLQAF